MSGTIIYDWLTKEQENRQSFEEAREEAVGLLEDDFRYSGSDFIHQ